MMESDFTSYLRTQRCLKESTVTSRVSNCRRVEQYEGNLDEHYYNDTMRTLLSRLIYSADDEEKNLPPRHEVPINGNLRNGSATLRQAVSLYQQFRHLTGNEAATTDSRRESNADQTNAPGRWPEWPNPQDDDVLRLAKVLTPLVRFLHPDIVRSVTEDNRKHSERWSSNFAALGVDPDIYLWQGSPCALLVLSLACADMLEMLRSLSLEEIRPHLSQSPPIASV